MSGIIIIPVLNNRMVTITIIIDYKQDFKYDSDRLW